MIAAVYGKSEVVKVLLEYGADQSTKNNKGSTALDLAERCKKHEVVKILKHPPKVAKKKNEEQNEKLLETIQSLKNENDALKEQLAKEKHNLIEMNAQLAEKEEVIRESWKEKNDLKVQLAEREEMIRELSSLKKNSKDLENETAMKNVERQEIELLKAQLVEKEEMMKESSKERKLVDDLMDKMNDVTTKKDMDHFMKEMKKLHREKEVEVFKSIEKMNVEMKSVVEDSKNIDSAVKKVFEKEIGKIKFKEDHQIEEKVEEMAEFLRRHGETLEKISLTHDDLTKEELELQKVLKSPSAKLYYNVFVSELSRFFLAASISATEYFTAQVKGREKLLPLLIEKIGKLVPGFSGYFDLASGAIKGGQQFFLQERLKLIANLSLNSRDMTFIIESVAKHLVTEPKFKPLGKALAKKHIAQICQAVFEDQKLSEEFPEKELVIKVFIAAVEENKKVSYVANYKPGYQKLGMKKNEWVQAVRMWNMMKGVVKETVSDAPDLDEDLGL
jgi:hypothetical protein